MRNVRIAKGGAGKLLTLSISVCIITRNEEANLLRTLASVSWVDEVIIVDSGSTDRTCEIARGRGARVFVEEWKGFAAQKNSAIEKASSDWVLSLDADEEVSAELSESIRTATQASSAKEGYFLPRRNLFLGRWIKRGGFYPDAKLRLWKRGFGSFQERAVHETAKVSGSTATLQGDLIHYSYPTLEQFVEHMNRYSSLGAHQVLAQKPVSIPLHEFLMNVWARPVLTFAYNYLIRGGFLDGREGLLLHLYHAVYVSWKYAKQWELSRKVG